MICMSNFFDITSLFIQINKEYQKTVKDIISLISLLVTAYIINQ